MDDWKYIYVETAENSTDGIDMKTYLPNPIHREITTEHAPDPNAGLEKKADAE